MTGAWQLAQFGVLPAAAQLTRTGGGPLPAAWPGCCACCACCACRDATNSAMRALSAASSWCSTLQAGRGQWAAASLAARLQRQVFARLPQCMSAPKHLQRCGGKCLDSHSPQFQCSSAQYVSGCTPNVQKCGTHWKAWSQRLARSPRWRCSRSSSPRSLEEEIGRRAGWHMVG